MLTQRLEVAGGAERLLVEEMQRFLKLGWDVRIVCFHYDRRALYGQDWLEEHLKVIGDGTGNRLREVLSLRSYIRSKDFDVIVAHTHIAAAYTLMASLGKSIPYVTHIHGSLFWLDGDRLKYSLVNRRVFRRIRNSVLGHQEFIAERPQIGMKEWFSINAMAIVDQLAVRRSSAIITLTEQLQWELKELYGADSFVVRGCLTEDQLVRRNRLMAKQALGLEGRKALLSVGRLDRRKRVDVLIRAFAMVSREISGLTLVVGGTGEEGLGLRALAVELGVESDVRFEGFIPDERLPTYYAASDVFLFPSWTSSGITTYEAMAQGCKVVWTSEATEPVLSWPGVRVSDPNAEAFARAIADLLQSHEMVPEDMSQYSWDRFTNSVVDICHSVVRRSRR